MKIWLFVQCALYKIAFFRTIQRWCTGVSCIKNIAHLLEEVSSFSRTRKLRKTRKFLEEGAYDFLCKIQTTMPSVMTRKKRQSYIAGVYKIYLSSPWHWKYWSDGWKYDQETECHWYRNCVYQLSQHPIVINQF